MKNNKKRFLVFVALTLIIAVVTGCANSGSPASNAEITNNSNSTANSNLTARSLEQIKESGKIVIGVFSDKKPFGYVDANGEYQGYDIYFGNRIAEELGVEVEYVPVDPASRVEYLVTAKVDIILANFTVTKERAEKVDFALPYMKVALGVVSPDSALITDVEQLKGKTLIVSKGTTADAFFTENYPDVKLLKFDQYTEAYGALLDGRGDAFSTDNTEVLAWAIENKGYTVGIETLGSLDTIAPAVQKGNTELLNWLNDLTVGLADEKFFHDNYEATLAPVYGGAANPENIVIEGGVIN